MKISVIIPVYNVEKYLRQCLDSVINQTYKNLEIICIDDCSSDSSLNILHDYAKKDNRIIIIENKTNLKAGTSRNKGIEVASGDYISFVDSDDWLELKTYEKLANLLEKNNIDVIQFLLRYVKNGIINQDSVQLSKEDKVYNLKDNHEILKYWSWHLCNRIYSKKFLLKNNISFNNFPCFEDTLFSLKCLINAKSIYFYNVPCYNYRKDNETALTANYEKHMDYAHEYFQYSVKLCRNMDEELREKFLIWEFSNIYIMCFYLYKDKKFSYIEFRKMLSKFDYSIFKKASMKKGYLAHSQEILKYPEGLFLLKSTLRENIKKFIPILYKIVMKIKDAK